MEATARRHVVYWPKDVLPLVSDAYVTGSVVPDPEKRVNVVSVHGLQIDRNGDTSTNVIGRLHQEHRADVEHDPDLLLFVWDASTNRPALVSSTDTLFVMQPPAKTCHADAAISENIARAESIPPARELHTSNEDMFYLNQYSTWAPFTVSVLKSNFTTRRAALQIALDQMFGALLGLFTLYNIAWLAHEITIWVPIIRQALLNDWITWLLTGQPAGLKLNTNLGTFVGKILLGYVGLWHGVVQIMLDQSVVLLYIVAIVGIVFGCSVMFVAIVDLISLLTFDLYWIAKIMCFRVLGLFTAILRSMFRLFNGKKANILKGRIDTEHYYLDQLLLGTLIFTVVSFLIPTMLLYCSLFLVLYIIIQVIKVCLMLPCLLFCTRLINSNQTTKFKSKISQIAHNGQVSYIVKDVQISFNFGIGQFWSKIKGLLQKTMIM
mmetsp:Transcript_18385/g.20438  ORF Transcript_18385/g.20438 Transcript_18385/m.20438 type:complete len:435 (+) Transcript_18385:53-1357(+)